VVVPPTGRPDTTGTGTVTGNTGIAGGISETGPTDVPETPPGQTGNQTGEPDEIAANQDNTADSDTAVEEIPPVLPNQGSTAEPGTSAFANMNLPWPLIIAIGALLLLLILLIIFLRMRSLDASPNKVMAQAGPEDSAAKNAELLNSFASRQAVSSLQGPPRRSLYRDSDSDQFLTKPPMLNLFVENQNTAIGRRNVHALKAGSTYSVGGGNSDFLIFLVPIPARVGRLYFDGTNCTFTPLKPEFFPDLGSTPVRECIGKTIRLISKKNYEIFFHFERYKDPLLVLNQLLHSIQVPEAPKLQQKNR
jgi:hypothetical protein